MRRTGKAGVDLGDELMQAALTQLGVVNGNINDARSRFSIASRTMSGMSKIAKAKAVAEKFWKAC